MGVIFSSDIHAALPSTWSSAPSFGQQSEESTPSSTSSYNRSVHTQKSSSYGEISPFTPGSHNVALDLGQVFLMGDLSDGYENSLGTQFHYTYGVSDLFGFDSSLGYSEHSNGEFSMINLLSGVRMNLSWYDRVIPYFVAGLGFYRPSYKNGYNLLPGGALAYPNTQPYSLSAILFGIHFGPGVDLQISKSMFFGATLTFHSMFGSSQTLPNQIPITVGGSYTSFLIHLGSSF
jgi:hypothetical protein